MAINYANLAAVAKRLVEENGRSVKLIRDSRLPSDDDRPWRGNDHTKAEFYQPAIAVFMEYNLADLEGEQVRRGDQMAIVAASSVTEDLRGVDRLMDIEANQAWNVIHVQPIKPGPLDVLYIFHLRQ